MSSHRVITVTTVGMNFRSSRTVGLVVVVSSHHVLGSLFAISVAISISMCPWTQGCTSMTLYMSMYVHVHVSFYVYVYYVHVRVYECR